MTIITITVIVNCYCYYLSCKLLGAVAPGRHHPRPGNRERRLLEATARPTPNQAMIIAIITIMIIIIIIARIGGCHSGPNNNKPGGQHRDEPIGMP